MKFTEWISDRNNGFEVDCFLYCLIPKLQSCFHLTKNIRAQHEYMWEKFYKLRSSHEFKSMWIKFLLPVVFHEASPIFLSIHRGQKI